MCSPKWHGWFKVGPPRYVRDLTDSPHALAVYLKRLFVSHAIVSESAAAAIVFGPAAQDRFELTGPFKNGIV